MEQGDIKQAFLNSTPLEREIYLIPPKEGLAGVRPGELLAPCVTPYGLCDAPRAWWKELDRIGCEGDSGRKINARPEDELFGVGPVADKQDVQLEGSRDEI